MIRHTLASSPRRSLLFPPPSESMSDEHTRQLYARWLYWEPFVIVHCVQTGASASLLRVRWKNTIITCGRHMIRWTTVRACAIDDPRIPEDEFRARLALAAKNVEINRKSRARNANRKGESANADVTRTNTKPRPLRGGTEGTPAEGL